MFAYQEDRGAEFITGPLQILMDRKAEWWDRERILILNADIQAAFDFMRPELVRKALRAALVHPRIIAAMMRENAFLIAHPEFQGVQLEEPILFNRCARQGGVESAYEWNCVVCLLLQDLVPAWLEKGWGVNIGGRLHTHVVWADNFWLLASSAESLQKMFQSLTDVIHSHKG